MGAGKALLQLLFPTRCPFCRSLLKREEGLLCADCQRELPWLNGARAVRSGEFFRLCVSPLAYEGRVRTAFHRYKFQGRKGCAKAYGTLIAQCIADHLQGEYDCITWVPLSKKRLRERGYDQAGLLAQTAAERLGREAVPMLRKRGENQVQSSLKGAASRRANVLGCYEVTDRALTEGKRILIIDDVITTGATLSECARELKTAGASDVLCATLASTGRENR